ncbi:hypothetical protein [Bacillus sp. AFS031507]|uniref:hypothetical protein n=1 Tax=Bacillus sp. AFS031507 TaxID=2033496 RepID=UPI000BFC7A8F|nr:hypothetical protein [Bacillus sp. AFS031507]PGY08214.1 hypothetical protein COE25_23105 [Bacillus sp. AFS031507]
MGIDKFSAALGLLKGFSVNLYVGEDVFNGKLIGVEADHVVLETDNKYVFYYNIDKIQAITKNTREFQPEKTNATFQKTQSLIDLLHSFQHTWITILTINKQRFTGVLSEIDTDFATLINGDERILIKLTHVSNILKGIIKEEAVKTASSNENEKGNKDSDNKNESKDQSSSSGDKECSKNHSSSSGDKMSSKNHSSSSGDKECSKNHSSSSGDKEDSKKKKQKNSNSKENSAKKKEEPVKEEVIEPNNTMVWSQPIKIESTMVQTKDEVVSNIFKVKKSQTDENDSFKNSTEMKPVKEAVSIQKTDNQPAPPYKLQQIETKSTKTQEEAANVVKSATTQNQANKKSENNKPNDMNTNINNQNVWTQKEKEQKVLRYSGEPVNPDSKIAFPFSGWPNRNNRTSRLN